MNELKSFIKSYENKAYLESGDGKMILEKMKEAYVELDYLYDYIEALKNEKEELKMEIESYERACSTWYYL